MRAQMRNGTWQVLPQGACRLIFLIALILATLTAPTHAAFVTFENCLPDSILDSDPLQLQFTPCFVDATFLPDGSSHNLSLTIYGNVSGQQFTTDGPLPAAGSPYWSNGNETNGKIVNVGSDDKYSTLTADYQVLTYTAYDNRGQEFCPTLVNGSCPLGPAFRANGSNPYDLPAFFITHDFGSSYAFSTISTTVHVISGDEGGADIACVSAQITPDIGPNIIGLLTWLPAAILIIKGLATLAAAIWSPWGSSDIFRWSSNYGRDEDLLRLVTPGFGDCLQYIQFVVLTGSLTIQYPGFYQPAVSQAAWSSLLFNYSFVSGGDGYQSLRDGLYTTNATYGLTEMSQLIGMSEGKDIWAQFAIWLLVIAAVVLVLCQIGFLGRWLYHVITHTTEEDLRQKNVPFTLGNMIRLLFNFFILPIVALSLFQLVLAPRGPTSVVACAVVLLAIMVFTGGWCLKVIFATKPRTLLFDDMPTVLLYGPLYNTYSDSAAPFALVPVGITFMRGVAIGAIQPSGIAQIIVLAICEVILILTLNGFRPFQGQTSMNLYHTFFASVRLATILLMIAFVPSLGVTEAPKGWIGYVILLLHACVLVFGFFLNSAQTLVEVIARSMGAGGDAQHGAVRGSILNWRMLKKRQDRRRDQADRGSTMSSAAILRDSNGEPNAGYGTRSRSISASSQQLLNRMSGFENFSQGGEIISSPDPEMEHSNTFVSGSGSAGNAAGRPSIGAAGAKAEADGFYRPPRARKATMETLANPGAKTRSTADFPYTDSPSGHPGHARDASYDSGAFGSPAPAYLRDRQGSSDDAPRTDYAVREVDQYYRGPALNEQATRKLKTGPADPVGPASTAQSWFQRLMFGVSPAKKKDQSKGFEVVRSSRLPPGMQKEPRPEDGMEMQNSPVMHQEPYRDAPDTPGVGVERELQAEAGAERSTQPSTSLERSISPTDDIAQHPPTTGFDFGFDGSRNSRMTNVRPDSDALGYPGLEPISFEHAGAMGVTPTPPRRLSQASAGSASQYTGRRSSVTEDDGNGFRYSDQPIPSLAPIDIGGLDLPSRFNSNASRLTTAGQAHQAEPEGVSRLRSNRSNAPPTIDIGDTPGGQEWLRAVDQLAWPSVQPNRQGDTSGGLTSPPPSLPRRNSRRTPSQEVRYGGSQRSANNVFAGFDSPGEGESPGEEQEQRQRQPSATPQQQHVSHHRAADSISRNSFGAAAALRGMEGSVEYGTPPTEGYLGGDTDRR